MEQPEGAGARRNAEHDALAALVTEDDQADVVVFLAGHGSRYITGATIDINGGRFIA